MSKALFVMLAVILAFSASQQASGGKREKEIEQNLQGAEEAADRVADVDAEDDQPKKEGSRNPQALGNDLQTLGNEIQGQSIDDSERFKKKGRGIAAACAKNPNSKACKAARRAAEALDNDD